MNANSVCTTVGFRVRYRETDQMGVVNHAVYFTWFEEARSEMCRQHGISYAEMEANGMYLPMVEIKARYHAPARYDNEVEVTATVVEVRRSFLKVSYQVRSLGVLLATGDSLMVLTSKSTGKPIRFPEGIRQKLAGETLPG